MDDKEKRAKAYKIIYEIIAKGEFPRDTVEERHLDKIYGYRFLSDDKIRFFLDRHPHYIHGVSLGGPSSAFKTQTYQYELDMIKKEIIEISVEVGELELEYRKLAQEGVEWLDNVSTVFDSTFNEIKDEAEAQQFAISEFKRIDWMEEYEGEEDLPEDFKPRLLEEIKKEFVSKVLGFWQEYKMHYEN